MNNMSMYFRNHDRIPYSVGSKLKYSNIQINKKTMSHNRVAYESPVSEIDSFDCAKNVQGQRQSLAKINRLEQKMKLVGVAFLVILLWLFLHSVSSSSSCSSEAPSSSSSSEAPSSSSSEVFSEITSPYEVDNYVPNREEERTIGESSVPTVCSSSILTRWNHATMAHRQEFKGMAIEKMPFPHLNLVLDQLDQHTTFYHFHEMIFFFKNFKVESPLYIHSGPLEMVLLIGAKTTDEARLVVSEFFPEKDLVLINFSVNNLLKKIRVEASGESEKNLEEASLIVTTSSETFRRYGKQKMVLLYVDKDQPHPGGSVYKVDTEGYCERLEIAQFNYQTLSQGIYTSALL